MCETVNLIGRSNASTHTTQASAPQKLSEVRVTPSKVMSSLDAGYPLELLSQGKTRSPSLVFPTTIPSFRFQLDCRLFYVSRARCSAHSPIFLFPQTTWMRISVPIPASSRTSRHVAPRLVGRPTNRPRPSCVLPSSSLTLVHYIVDMEAVYMSCASIQIKIGIRSKKKHYSVLGTEHLTSTNSNEESPLICSCTEETN